eukprot:6568669-Prymnesium_polylepis.2
MHHACTHRGSRSSVGGLEAVLSDANAVAKHRRRLGSRLLSTAWRYTAWALARYISSPVGSGTPRSYPTPVYDAVRAALRGHWQGQGGRWRRYGTGSAQTAVREAARPPVGARSPRPPPLKGVVVGKGVKTCTFAQTAL